jgi:hypothetical protein
MGKHALLAVGGGGLSAAASLAVVSGASGGLVLAYFAPLPLLLVGLGLGTNAAALAASVGLVAVALTSGAVGAGVYGGLHALPSWLVVYQALRRRAEPGTGSDGAWYPVGAIAATLAAITGFSVACTAVVGGGGEGIEPAVRALVERAMTNVAPTLDDAQRDALADALAPLFVGLTGASWQLMIAINAVLAVTMLAARGWALRPKPRWGTIAVPGWLSWPLAAAAAVGLAGDGDTAYVARNLVIVLALPYLFVGLAVVHHLSRSLPGRPLLLSALYLGLLLLGAAVATLLAGLGMVAQWSGRWPIQAGRAFGNRE